MWTVGPWKHGGSGCVDARPVWVYGMCTLWTGGPAEVRVCRRVGGLPRGRLDVGLRECRPVDIRVVWVETWKWGRV